MANRQYFKDWFTPRHKLEKDKVEDLFDSIKFIEDDGVGHIITDNGAVKANRKKLNIIGATITDDEISDSTIINLGIGSVNDKGWHPTDTALVAAFPVGAAGWYAVVASTNTFWIWNVSTSAWVNSGNTSLVTSVNTKTGIVSLTAADIPETSGLKWLTSTLKTAYDSAVAHMGITGNPHGTTAGDVGAYTTNEINSLVSSLHYYAIGVYTLPTITDNGDGTVTIGNGEYCLFDNTSGKGFIKKVIIIGSTISLTNNANNFIYADWNGGTPILAVTDTESSINNTSQVKVFEIWRSGNELHIIKYTDSANNASNRIDAAQLGSLKVRHANGLSISLVRTRNLLVSIGSVFIGSIPTTLAEINTSTTERIILYKHVAGVWTRVTGETQLSNSQYDNGFELQTISDNNYAVNWLFRGLDEAKTTYLLLGAGNYNIHQAQTCKRPTLPAEISNHAIYIGKVIIKKGQSSATLIQSAFDVTQNAPIMPNHNDMPGIQGGDSANMIHLTQAEYDSLINGSAGLSLGETSTTAYRGDRGKAAYDFAQAQPAINDAKVDKVTGKSLIADTEITRLAGINDHYRGTYLTKAALELAIPVGNAGDEATVDAGVGSDPIKYIWDTSDNAWKQGGGGSVTVDQSVINGSTNAVSGGAVYNALETKAPIRPATTKAALVDADETTGNDSASAFGQIKTTWGDVKAFLKSYFDGLYGIESIMFLSTSDFGVITRSYNFKITAKTDTGGVATIKTSADVAYALNATINAGDYVKIYGDTLNMRTFLTVDKV